MDLRTATTILLLFPAIVPLSGQAPGQELWRSTVTTADELKTEGRFAEAERMFRSALDQARRLEPDLAPAATTYNNLAGLYQDMGRCDPAVQAYQRSIDLWEKVGARGEVYLLRTANHLVGLYLECGDAQEAARHQHALVTPRIAAGAGRVPDPDAAQALTNLGSIHFEKRRYSEARAAYEEALAIRNRISAAPSAEMGILLNNLAFSVLRTGEIELALAHSRRSIAIIESTGGPSHPLLISALVNGANLRLMAGRWSEAEPLLDRALALARSVVGDEHSLTVTVMSSYAALLKASHRKKQAAALETRVREIRARLLLSAARKTVDVRELSRLK